MKTRQSGLYRFIITMILVLGVIAVFHEVFAVALPDGEKEHPLHIRKMRNKWKVVDAGDSTRTMVKTKKGEAVVWMALGSDVFLQFPDTTLFGTDNATITEGKKLRLRVLPTAQSGRYTYSIFCLTDKAYATGDSPPVIIVE